MGSQLVPPPKFSGPLGQAPTTIQDWVQFLRWLFSLFQVAQASISAPQSISISPQSIAGINADEILAAALAASRNPQPTDAVLGQAIEAFFAQSSKTALPVNPGDTFPFLPAFSIPTAQQPAAPGATPVSSQLRDELDTLLMMALSKQPYPAPPATGGGNTTAIFAQKTVTANYNLTTSDTAVYDASTSGTTAIALPDATTCAGQLFAVGNEGLGALTQLGAGVGQTIGGKVNWNLNPNESVIVQSDGTNYQVWATLAPPVEYTAAATMGLTLTTSMQDVPGMSVTVAQSGTFLISWSLAWDQEAADGFGYSQCLIASSAQTGNSQSAALSPAGILFSQSSITIEAPASAGNTIKIQAKKVSGAGTSAVLAPNAGSVPQQGILTVIYLHQ